MSTTQRVEEIAKAINSIGWIATLERLKTEEDKTIFSELSAKFDKKQKAEVDAILKRKKISL